MSDDKWTDYFFRILNGLSVLFFLSSVGLFVTVAWLAVVGR